MDAIGRNNTSKTQQTCYHSLNALFQVFGGAAKSTNMDALETLPFTLDQVEAAEAVIPASQPRGPELEIKEPSPKKAS